MPRISAANFPLVQLLFVSIILALGGCNSTLMLSESSFETGREINIADHKYVVIRRGGQVKSAFLEIYISQLFQGLGFAILGSNEANSKPDGTVLIVECSYVDNPRAATAAPRGHVGDWRQATFALTDFTTDLTLTATNGLGFVGPDNQWSPKSGKGGWIKPPFPYKNYKDLRSVDLAVIGGLAPLEAFLTHTTIEESLQSVQERFFPGSS